MLRCSIGVMAFDEESNIGHLLEALASQRLQTCVISEIVVVSSGSTDRTEEIVASHAESNRKVRLLSQEEREGKASAINFFIRQASGEIVVIESGDTLPTVDAIENLVRPFHDPEVGMTGAHPVPLNAMDNFLGYTVNLFWRLHHELARRDPKLGELIAFRNIIEEIPKDTPVDEATVEAMIEEAGFRIHYAEDAIVRNKGPETIADYLRQRRRVMVGHKLLERTRGYRVSTMKLRNLLHLFWQMVRTTNWSVKTVCWFFGAIGLEAFGRLLGDYDHYVKRENPFVWDIAESTKRLRDD
jgi:biofilm PGA synthesis N-glycosyltransferase PgaC